MKIIIIFIVENLYKLVKFHDVEKKVRALIISKLKHNNNHDEKLRVTQKYLKLNRWVGVPNKHCFELFEVLGFISAVEAAGVDDVRIVGSNDGYLENTFSILFADDLVDCIEDLKFLRIFLTRSGSKFGSRKPWNILSRRCCRILDTNMSQFGKVCRKAFFKKRNLSMIYYNL